MVLRAIRMVLRTLLLMALGVVVARSLVMRRIGEITP